MATPPRITDRERDAAVARIAARHERIDDSRRSEMGTLPRDIVSYVLDRGESGVPRWVAALDHQDALILTTWCWWEERRRERRLLRQGLRLGLSASELGAPLGMSSRQGLRDRLDRLDALLTHDRPDEQITRAARRSERERGGRQYWIDVHRDRIRAVVAALIAQSRRVLVDETVLGRPSDTVDAAGLIEADTSAGEWVEELAQDYADDAITPATFAVAGLLSAELRVHPRLQALDGRHRIHSALNDLDRLRSRYSTAITRTALRSPR